MTFDEFIKIGEIQSKTQKYKEKEKRAVATAVTALEDSQNPYVALSGGKDSVVTAYIVKMASNICNKFVRLWTHISDASFPNTKETCLEVAKRLNLKIDFFEPDFSAYDKMGEKQKSKFGKTGVYFESVRQYAKDKDLCFTGVRATESARRKRQARIHGQIFKSKSMGDVTTCNPILWFRLEDVAAFLFKYDCPIHPIYKKFSINNKDNSLKENMFIRLGYITSRDLLDRGTVLFLKINYPKQYSELVSRFPEIKIWG